MAPVTSDVDEPDGSSALGGSHRGVERVARILEAAASEPHGIRLVDIASLLDAPRSSIHSLLKGLVSVGYLEERDGRYLIGSALQSLLAPHQTSWIVNLAGNDVTRLSRALGETALIGTRVGDSIVYVFQAESQQSIHYTARVGERRGLFPTSMGKLYVAAMGDADIERFLENRPNLDRTAALADIEAIRREDIAYNRQETVEGVVAAASPIRYADGTIAAAISIAGPVYRMEKALAEIGVEIRHLAQQISQRIAGEQRAAGS